MIFALNYSFTVGNSHMRGGSVQQQLSLSKLSVRTSNNEFETGKVYSIYYIKYDVNEKVFVYTFRQTGTKTNIIKKFPDTTAADEFIARLEGSITELQKTRERIHNVQNDL